ncbi:MAG: hypothetical protein FRX48_03126 [Lasallia pustulata]|uniref:C2H2-type domain-containing protein n=1 Tax=Lasallia pustulata TaxID=136370 RepID=A0A5M8PUT2_9LECA|nr:MAG: hypothetical protein FRX48_03126 [Lasallia pustulata]
MSRSHSSGHSHSSRSRRVSNISVTETSFQGLHLGETVGSPQLSAPLSAYQGAAEQYRRRSPARPDPTAFYVQAGYDPSTFTRTSPSRGLTESYPTYYPLETANADLPAYPFDPAPSAFVSEPGPAQVEAYGAPDMSSYGYAQSPMLSGYSQQSSYSSPRSSSAQDYPFSRARLQSRTPSVLGSMPRENTSYPRRPMTSSVQGDYAGSVSGPSSHYGDYPQAYDMPPMGPMYSNPMTSTLAAPSDNVLQQQYPGSRTRGPVSSLNDPDDHQMRIVGVRPKPQCWDHGCNGRQFSTFSNLLRHQREKSGTASKSTCPRCGAEFTRTTARNGHMQHEKCKSRKTSDA